MIDSTTYDICPKSHLTGKRENWVVHSMRVDRGSARVSRVPRESVVRHGIKLRRPARARGRGADLHDRVDQLGRVWPGRPRPMHPGRVLLTTTLRGTGLAGRCRLFLQSSPSLHPSSKPLARRRRLGPNSPCRITIVAKLVPFLYGEFEILTDFNIRRTNR